MPAECIRCMRYDDFRNNNYIHDMDHAILTEMGWYLVHDSGGAHTVHDVSTSHWHWVGLCPSCNIRDNILGSRP
jgi:hypothetical protein